MKQAIWSESYPVSSFLVDFSKKLGLRSLMNLLQETAWRHAAHLGHGYAETHERGVAWVLIRQRVEIDRWPDWGQTLTVRTWLRPPGPVVITRDFQLLVEGDPVGQAAAHWITIDERTRRPIALAFPDQPGLFRADGHLSCDPVKLPVVSEGFHSLAEFEVRVGDLDMNAHVNNTRIAQWVLDSLPLQTHRDHLLRGYQVNFLAEARPGDRVAVKAPRLGSAGLMPFQGWRAIDDRVLFTALLQAEAIG